MRDAIGGTQRHSEALSGNQWPSEALTWNCIRSSGVITGHQASSHVIRRHQWSPGIASGRTSRDHLVWGDGAVVSAWGDGAVVSAWGDVAISEASSDVIRCHQASSAAIRGHHLGETLRSPGNLRGGLRSRLRTQPVGSVRARRGEHLHASGLEARS
jgi:hypothetical protein